MKFFRDFVKDARNNNLLLEITFKKVTTNTTRTIQYATAANVGYRYEEIKEVSSKTLKTIMKNHDRVFVQNVKYVGAYFVFPELISEYTYSMGTVSGSKVHKLPDGSRWQWRSLYVDQISEVKLDGKVVWKNDDLFNFNLVGPDGEIRSVMTKAEYDAEIKSRQEYENERIRNAAYIKFYRRKVDELAKTLKPEDCCVNNGFLNSRHWTPPSERTIRAGAIDKKHEQLMRLYPEQHVITRESDYDSHHGYHHIHCSCGYKLEWDSTG